MSYDDEVDLPEDAQAVIIAPSIVGDRYVQITPAYTGGDTLADGATLATDNTSVPLELDQIYSSLNDLNVALGPDGANKNGALTDLLEVTADNFGGQGEQFNQTISNFSQLSQTLDDNKEELFGSAAQLEEFVCTLAQNDSTVRAFNQSLSDVSTMLNGEKEELAAALKNLSVALGEVTTFVKDNKATPVAQHQGHQPGRQGPGQAARGPRGDAHQRPGRAQQPGTDLQPAGGDARHQRQPRVAARATSPPTRPWCSAPSSSPATRRESCATRSTRSCRGPGCSRRGPGRRATRPST